MIVRVIIFLAIAMFAYLFFSKAGSVIDTLRTTEINVLLKKPKEFDGQRVQVTGTVLRGVAVLGLGGFVLGQDGAEIVVLTTRGSPEIGATVTVEGVFKQGFAIDGLQVGVVFEKK